MLRTSLSNVLKPKGCFGEHPLSFVHSLDSVITHTKAAATLLEESFDSMTPRQLQQHCKEDVHILIPTISTLHSIMGDVQRQVRAIIELTGCHQISPVIRRITLGVTCSDTVDAMTWLFVGMWCITLIGFAMLAVRAALFNPVIRAPRRKRQKEREKEFEEYKDYMATYYQDAGRWQLHEHKKAVAVETIEETIPQVPTFETDEMSFTGRSSDETDGSDIACFASPLPKSDASSASAYSYESDYSSDSDDDKSNMSLSLLVGRIFQGRNSADDQSQVHGMSTVSHRTHDRSLGILELQTPRRRRKQSLPFAYHLDENSPMSVEGDSARFLTSPQSGVRLTPLAPSKPKRILYTTDKES